MKEKVEKCYDFDFKEGEELTQTIIEATEKETKPPARYSEASFVKELDKQGIGRPSTYASIVSVLLDESRNYCKIIDKNIVPTEKGINLSHFLDKSFNDIINVNYTAKLEKDLDKIASGKETEIQFLKDFYSKLEDSIKKVESESVNTDLGNCPDCGSPLVYRRGKYGTFIGCSGYPKCHFIKNINKK